jgi:ABC-type nickel/cobalt efflux system permease component RcnA
VRTKTEFLLALRFAILQLRGNANHPVGLELLVSVARAAGVYLLGAVVLLTSRYVIPERLYPWLSIVSGLAIAVLASYLLVRAWTGETGDHIDENGVPHSHWIPGGSWRAQSADVSNSQRKTVSLRRLATLSITGNIMPWPVALIVLLSAISLHRVGLGLFLIVTFSFGLAAVLILIDVLLVHTPQPVSRFESDLPWVRKWLPFISAGMMLAAGLAIAISAIPKTGIAFSFAVLTHNRLASFVAIVLLGLFLGVRHSTDPDHVVAVSTIVSRERSVRQGALIGMLWGLGHTVTIFMVGSAIILFGLTIPPRLGLSMELAVAGMLILLGILNLTGLLRRLTERLTPANWTVAGTQLPAPPDARGGARSLVKKFGYYQLLRPLSIGLVHGLAGSAAVALLVLSLIRNPLWAIAYLVVFGLGTVIGMMAMTTVMAIPIALSGKKSSRYLTVASGLVSVCFGLFLIYRIGFVDGLFTGHVHWTPQ